MMKKMLAALLALSLSLGAFAACSKGDAPGDETQTDASLSETAGDQTASTQNESTEPQTEPATTAAPTEPEAPATQAEPDTAAAESGKEIDYDKELPGLSLAPMPTFSFNIPTYVAPDLSMAQIHIEPFEFHFDIKPFTYEGKTIDMSDFEIKAFDFDGLRVFVPEDQQIDLDGIDEARMQEILQKEESLLKKLTDALNKSGLNVKTDPATGEVSLDSSVLFGGDSSALSDAGKRFLREFAKAYTEVMLDREYNGFLAEIRVEGHCAPVAGDTYETAFPLSQERAEVVRDYLLSDECGLDAAGRNALKKLLTAQGLSNLYPVKNASGQVDMAASRRVAFRFLVNVG